MKKFLDTLRNIWRIDELRKRILYTLGLLMIFRLGSFVVLPGIDPVILGQLQDDGGSRGIEDLINLFAGGAFSRASVFALGIMPYISASIVMQLLTLAVPQFQKLQKEGESGRNKINQLTRYLTILITFAQSIGFVINLQQNYINAVILREGTQLTPTFWLSTMVVLTAGTMFVMWLGERITEKGLGNGISLLITVGIVANLPDALWLEFDRSISGEGGSLVFFLVEMAILFVIIAATIALVQAVRKIPIQVAKRQVASSQRTLSATSQRQYIPLKVNAAGVMPIIFAQAIMFLPGYVANFFPNNAFSQSVARAFFDWTSFPYNLTLGLLIIVFTYFYTSLTVQPDQMADDMKRSGAFIPGVKPGKATSDYIDEILSRITLPGSIFLAIISILPAFAFIAGANQQFAQFFGGTSLLIMVAVVLDTLQQIESYLLMRQYDGLMKTGKIKGRAVGAQF